MVQSLSGTSPVIVHDLLSSQVTIQSKNGSFLLRKSSEEETSRRANFCRSLTLWGTQFLGFFTFPMRSKPPATVDLSTSGFSTIFWSIWDGSVPTKVFEFSSSIALGRPLWVSLSSLKSPERKLLNHSRTMLSATLLGPLPGQFVELSRLRIDLICSWRKYRPKLLFWHASKSLRKKGVNQAVVKPQLYHQIEQGILYRICYWEERQKEFLTSNEWTKIRCTKRSELSGQPNIRVYEDYMIWVGNRWCR